VNAQSRCGRGVARTPLSRPVAAALAIFLVVALAACASMPPDRIAYNTLDGVTRGVQAGVKAWGDLYAQGHYTAADRAKVEAAYKKFQAANRLAIAIAEAADSEDQKRSALAIANAAADELFALLRALGVS
jgi:hypothetical protein